MVAGQHHGRQALAGGGAERLARGKPEHGTITLVASHQGDAANVGNDGLSQRMKSLTSQLLGTDSTINSRTEGIKSLIERNKDKIERIDVRATLAENRLRAQYTLLDNNMAKLNGLRLPGFASGGMIGAAMSAPVGQSGRDLGRVDLLASRDDQTVPPAQQVQAIIGGRNAALQTRFERNRQQLAMQVVGSIALAVAMAGGPGLITELLLDRQERLWIGTESDGLLVVEPDGTEAEYFQFYTRAFARRVFFELVERRGYDGYGAVNAPIRLAAQARSAPEPTVPKR